MLYEKIKTRKSHGEEGEQSEVVPVNNKMFGIKLLEELLRLQSSLGEIIQKAKESEPEIVKDFRDAGINLETNQEPTEYPQDRNMI